MAPEAGQHHPADADIPQGFHQADGAADVGKVVFTRVKDGLGHGDAGGQVVDAIDLLEQGPQLGTVIHVATGKMDIRVKHLRITGGKVVEPAYHVAFTGKLVGKMGTEEAGRAGDEKIHG